MNEIKLYPVNFVTRHKTKKINRYSFNDLISKIKNERCSIIRYGDGESNLFYKKVNICFQKYDERLKNLLIEALQYEDKKLLIGILLVPHKYYHYRHGMFKYIKINKTYFNALYFRNGDRNSALKIMEIWKNRDVVLITKYNSNFRTLTKIFKKVKSIEYIKCLATNTFTIYDELKEKCLKLDKSKLIILMAGPTATVLAYELHKEGYQTMDIGRFYKSYQRK